MLVFGIDSLFKNIYLIGKINHNSFGLRMVNPFIIQLMFWTSIFFKNNFSKKYLEKKVLLLNPVFTVV